MILTRTHAGDSRFPTIYAAARRAPRSAPLATLLLATAIACAPALKAQEIERFEFRATADSTILSHQPKARAMNFGARDHLELQANLRFALMQFDLNRLAGMRVERATLVLRRTRDMLVRVGLGTIAAAWDEGASNDGRATEGGVCYQYARYHETAARATPWAWPGSDFGDVAFGEGGSRWTSAVARFDRERESFEIDVPAAMVQALAQGLQPGGLALADEFHREPIAAIASREAFGGPLLVVEARRVPTRTSVAPKNVRTLRDELGVEWVEFEAAQAIGFEVVVTGSDRASAESARRLETWALPTPGPGRLRAMLVAGRGPRDTHVAVRAVEAAADWSDWESAPLPPVPERVVALDAPKLPRFDLPREIRGPFVADDGVALSRDGIWIRSSRQTWFDPMRGPVSLQAGRNEFVAFQVFLAGVSGAHQVRIAEWASPSDAAPAPRAALFRQHYVKARLGKDKYGPDAAVPLRDGELMNLAFDAPRPASAQPATEPGQDGPDEPEGEVPGPADDKADAGGPPPPRMVQGVWVELFVPRGTSTGVWRSRVVVVRDGAAVLDVPIELEVVSGTLPDELGFAAMLGSDKPLAELGAGDSPDGVDDARRWATLDACYRMAHTHRATFAYDPMRVDGSVEAGFAPAIRAAGESATLDFEDWERRFARYFDGSAFRDLPRAGAPLSFFTLPFNENWPLVMQLRPAGRGVPAANRYHYRATWYELADVRMRRNPPIDAYIHWPIADALSGGYQEQTRRLMGQFAEYLSSRRWATQFHVAPSHYITGVRQGCWWNLELPQVMDDYLALRFWFDLYRSGGAVRGGPVKLRGTLSQPQFSRSVLDGMLDLSIIDMSLMDKQRHLLTRRERYGRLWQTGFPIDPEHGPAAMLRWVWCARLAGAEGVALRNCVGPASAWEDATTVALIYPPRYGNDGFVPSLRLKGLLRAQQDMEWLAAWQRSGGESVPTGYSLNAIGQEIVQRMSLPPSRNVNLLPVLELPGRLDTVVFEELRRGLRSAAR
ncbi:MAG: hypothetical protein HRU75_08340 [Planctomycetia bacterium]|nr:MAG: hypothetical protein HRU75_08340 [Planctomycetia bacterium]